MKSLRLKYPLPLLCEVLEVSRSGFYAWLTRSPSKHARDEGRLEVEIKAAHKRTRQTCGPERLQRDLAAHGVKVGISRIRRIRKKLGIRCKQIKKFRATTDSRHSLPVAENLLEQNFAATVPNQVWVSDLTYVPTEGLALLRRPQGPLQRRDRRLRPGIENYHTPGGTIPPEGRPPQTAVQRTDPSFRPGEPVAAPNISRSL